MIADTRMPAECQVASKNAKGVCVFQTFFADKLETGGHARGRDLIGMTIERPISAAAARGEANQSPQARLMSMSSMPSVRGLHTGVRTD
jgi:hypothetical protein